MDGKWKNGHSERTDITVQMEEQNHRFTLDNMQKVSGRLQIKDSTVIMEVKNLRPLTKGYKLFFIGRKNGNSVYKIMGDIIPDMHGNAELECKINCADIDGEGTDLSCFYIFMVAAMGKPLQPVLKGDMITHRRGAAQAAAGEESRHAEAVNVNRQCNEKPACRTYNGYYSEYILYKTAELMAESSAQTNISPFGDVWLVDNWRRITAASKLPIASAGAERQIKKYGHFIYGVAEGHFYLGVPGRHDEEEWPDRGRSGFVMWQSIRGSEEYGYWTMVIELKTGIITEIP